MNIHEDLPDIKRRDKKIQLKSAMIVDDNFDRNWALQSNLYQKLEDNLPKQNVHYLQTLKYKSGHQLKKKSNLNNDEDEYNENFYDDILKKMKKANKKITDSVDKNNKTTNTSDLKGFKIKNNISGSSKNLKNIRNDNKKHTTDDTYKFNNQIFKTEENQNQKSKKIISLPGLGLNSIHKEENNQILQKLNDAVSLTKNNIKLNSNKNLINLQKEKQLKEDGENYIKIINENEVENGFKINEEFMKVNDEYKNYTIRKIESYKKMHPDVPIPPISSFKKLRQKTNLNNFNLDKDKEDKNDIPSEEILSPPIITNKNIFSDGYTPKKRISVSNINPNGLIRNEILKNNVNDPVNKKNLIEKFKLSNISMIPLKNFNDVSGGGIKFDLNNIQDEEGRIMKNKIDSNINNLANINIKENKNTQLLNSSKNLERVLTENKKKIKKKSFFSCCLPTII